MLRNKVIKDLNFFLNYVLQIKNLMHNALIISEKVSFNGPVAVLDKFILI